MNKYLKCESCGFFNEASSEYLVFCESCKRKLPNNFRAWRNTHHEGSLYEFHLEVCQTSDPLQKKEPLISKESEKPTKKYKKGILIVALATVSVLLMLFIFQRFLGEASTENWTKEICGDYGLTLLSPLKLVPVNAPVSIANASLIQDIQAFSSDPASDFLLIAISTNFKPETDQIELQAGISNFIEHTANAPGISNFSVSQKETEISGIRGFEQSGSFTKNGVAKEFLGVGVTKDNFLWQIMTVYDKGNEELKSRAAQILKYAEIN